MSRQNSTPERNSLTTLDHAARRLYLCDEGQVGVWLPIPLSVRLDALAEIGEEAWAPAGRREVLSAILLAASPEAADLKRLHARYRAAKVSEATVGGFDARHFLYPPTPGPKVQHYLRRPFDPSKGAPPVKLNDELRFAARYRIGLRAANPLARRLRVLVASAREVHINTSRQQLISALILAAPTSGSKLAQMLDGYWHATVADALVTGWDDVLVDEA
jgi:hypothetical protein